MPAYAGSRFPEAYATVGTLGPILGGALGAHLGPLLFGAHFFIYLGRIWAHFGPWDPFWGGALAYLGLIGLSWMIYLHQTAQCHWPCFALLLCR